MDYQNGSEDMNVWSNQQGDGYPALSTFMIGDPDHETYVFRKFRKLGVRNILDLQGELIKIENDAENLEREAAARKDPDAHFSMKSWTTLDANAQKSDREWERKQRELAAILETKLKKYC
jgi:hypothetical protein